jgi:large subunit ribosomal protein L24
MNIKKNDNVIMLQGKDRGKKGKVTSVFPDDEKVVVEGLNTVSRHLRARKQGQVGQIIKKERPVSASNVMLLCPKCGVATRVGHKVEGKNKMRICKKCGNEI